MSIEDYALELGVTCEEVIDSLKKMGYNYKSKSDILDDEALTDFIDEETDNYWTVMHRDINEYLEALRNIIY